MKSRFGGKWGTNHCTVTDAAATIGDIAIECPAVTKVVQGIITSSRKTSGSSRRVKILKDGHALRVAVTGGASHQVLYVYSSDSTKTVELIRVRAMKVHFNVTVAL